MTIAEATGPDGDRVEDEPLALAPDQAAPPAAEEWSDAPLETEQLAFDEQDVRLPWLETDGDDEDFAGGNTGQLAILVFVGLLAILVIGGGVWWAVEHRKDEVLVADGSVVAAPKQSYKERPKDPGGKTFAGTGDTSFAVSEGQTRPAQLDQSAAPKVPVAAAGAGAAPASTGVGVQVAAYSSRASAEAGWTRLAAQYEALAGLDHRVVEGSADIGTVYRLQVLAADVSSAHALCGRLKASGLACQVKN